MSANFRPENLSDLSRKDLPVRVACGCGHRASLDPHELFRRFVRERWDGRMHVIGDHLRCSRCGARKPRVG